MDAQAKKKALFRAKLNAQKQEKRIDSPLVRYNENDQPICRICEVVLKSDSLWPAHQASRKHHEAIKKLKANAAENSRTNNVKCEPSKEYSKPKAEHSLELASERPQSSTSLPKPRPSSVLPPGFFDNPEAKRQRSDVAKLADAHSEKCPLGSAQTQGMEILDSLDRKDRSPSKDREGTKDNEITLSRENAATSKTKIDSDSRQMKGALPAGFFDDKDADLRARGITPVKLDVKDEYKEFEKLIQEDLQEVDSRLEEEEIDAADMIEVLESVEQRTYRERVEMLKRKKSELKAARSAHQNGTRIMRKESAHEESSGDSDSDSDENFTVDWRAKHL